MSYDGGCGDKDCELCKADAEAHHLQAGDRVKMNTDPNWLKAKSEQENGCEIGAGCDLRGLTSDELLQLMDPVLTDYSAALDELRHRLKETA